MTSKLSSPVLLLVAIGLLVTNFVLQRRVHELTNDVSQLESFNAPALGSSVDWIVGYDLGNRPIKFDYTQHSGKTLFLVLSPNCKYCDENWQYWHRLLRDSPSANVVFADTTGKVDAEYFAKRGIRNPKNVLKISPEMKWAYNLNATPVTFVLGRNGRVEGVWIGVLTNTKVQAIETVLKSANDAVN